MHQIHDELSRENTLLFSLLTERQRRKLSRIRGGLDAERERRRLAAKLEKARAEIAGLRREIETRRAATEICLDLMTPAQRDVFIRCFDAEFD